MSVKNELFELIKSLNKNEKRYFRLFALMQKGNKKYLILFDEISRQSTYDEQKAKKSLNDKNLVKHFAFNKNYLKSLILKSLVLYNSNNITDIKIQNLISTAKILFSKALFRQYFRTLGTAKKLAIKNERFGYLLEILDMEKNIIKKEELHLKKSRQIYLLAEDSLNILTNYFKYSRISSAMTYKYRSTGIRREGKHDSEIKKLMNAEILKSPKNALSAKALENYYRIKEIENISKGNHEGVYEAVRNRRKTYLKYPDAFKDSIIDYNIDTLTSLTDACIKLNRLDEAEKCLSRLNDINSVSESDIEDISITTSFYKFQILIKRKSNVEIPVYIDIVEQLLIKFDNKLLLDSELYIRFCIVKAYILINKYDKALGVINFLLSHKLMHKREDLRFYLLMLNLVVHFELKNYTLLNHLVRSTYRFLVKRKRLYKTETLVLKFLRKLPELTTGNRENLYDFIRQLNFLKKQPYEQNAFEYFDFLEWAKSLKL